MLESSLYTYSCVGLCFITNHGLCVIQYNSEFFFTGILILFNVWWYGHRATDMLQHPYFDSSCGVQSVSFLAGVADNA